MLYFIIRPLVRLSLRIFFSKIHLHNLEKIPLDRPVLLSSNHPSAFLEACLLATHFPKSLHFLVRGDIFINKFIINLLKQVHLTPIYRVSDGFKNLRANENTFSECHTRLKNNEVIVVYSEGNTTQEKRLRPIQKGLARIAFGALDKYPEMDLCIVPLGVNYTHPNDFRSEVMVEVGDPIELKEYYLQYKTDSIKAIGDLTQKVENEMKPLVIHIDKDEYLPLAEKVFLINKANNKYPFIPIIDRSGERFVKDKTASIKINAMTDEKRNEWNIKLQPAFDISEKIDIVYTISHIGKWINNIPFWLGTKIAVSKVKRVEFFASVLVGTTMFLYIFYFIILGILAVIFDSSAIKIWLILIITGLFYLFHRHRVEKEKLNRIKLLFPDLTLYDQQIN